MIGSDETQLAYELTNIQPEYELIHSQELADEVLSNYNNGKRFMYEYVTHLNTISVDNGTDTFINESINVPGRLMKRLFLLFHEPYAAGAGDSEIIFNPVITETKVIANGIPNKVYSQGMETRDIWEGVFKIMRDNDLHGSGLTLVNTEKGV